MVSQVPQDYPVNDLLDSFATLLSSELTTDNGYSQTVQEVFAEAERGDPEHYPYLRIVELPQEIHETPQNYSEEYVSFENVLNFSVVGELIYADVEGGEPDRRTILQKFAKDIVTALYRIHELHGIGDDLDVTRVATPPGSGEDGAYVGNRGMCVILARVSYLDKSYIGPLEEEEEE
ncbi:MAG TPA: hypothetical protein PLG59_09855 [bacterium]|nr:hypothetical protein [bacterium]HQQ00044.1 hypothetical protein [bacterium]